MSSFSLLLLCSWYFKSKSWLCNEEEIIWKRDKNATSKTSILATTALKLNNNDSWERNVTVRTQLLCTINS